MLDTRNSEFGSPAENSRAEQQRRLAAKSGQFGFRGSFVFFVLPTKKGTRAVVGPLYLLSISEMFATKYARARAIFV